MIARHVTLLSMLAGAALIVVPVWNRHDIRFIWNASASVPIGLYRIVPGNRVDVTDLAVVMPPAELAAFLDERRYLPRGLPLIKRVLALSGTTVCRRGSAIIAYGGIYGQALARDTRGRPLPDWQGCRTLHDGEAFFMNWDSPDSFDSRYFGPLPVTTIVGRAIPVWTTDDSNPAAESLREPVSDEP
jgi:conjugative transfer signal peptidase TraF